MATVEDAVQSQAHNIELATGRSMEEWVALVKASGKERHTDRVRLTAPDELDAEVVGWLLEAYERA